MPIKALSRGEFAKLVSIREKKKKNLAIDQLPLDKEPNQSARHKRPEESGVGI